MERGGGRGLGDDLWSWRGKQKRSPMNARKENEMTESQGSSSPGHFVRAIGESIRIRDGAPEYYPWAASSSDFSYEREDWLQMRDSDPEATFREDVKRNEAALQRMKNNVLAAEHSKLLLQEYGQQHSTFQPGSWLGEQQDLQYLMPGPDLQPGKQEKSADSTFELDPFSRSNLQAGQQQYPAYLPCDPTWPGEQAHSEQSMTGPVLQPGELQQSADSAIKLDPCSSMLQMEDLNCEAPNEVDISVEEVVLQIQAEVNDASGQQHSGHSSSGPSALHGEPQHSTPSSSQPGSSSGEQQHAECLMPGPSSKSGECPSSASKNDEVSSGLQSGQQQPLPHSSSAGEQRHLEPAAAGGSLPTEQQNSGLSWSSNFGPTGRPGKWQLQTRLGWLPVPFPKELLPADLRRRMMPQQQQQGSSSQTGVGQRPACSSQPGDRRHPVVNSSQLSDRRHPVGHNSRPRDPRLPPLSSKPGDRRQHPVASSS